MATNIERNRSSDTMTIFKILRILSGLSGKQFALRCGVSYPYWNELETGNKDNPSREVINKIAEACNIKPETLWYLAGKEHPKTAVVQRIMMERLMEYVNTL